MLVERKIAKIAKTSAIRRTARKTRMARAADANGLSIAMTKADDSTVTVTIAKVGAKYEKMLNLLSR